VPIKFRHCDPLGLSILIGLQRYFRKKEIYHGIGGTMRLTFPGV